VEINFSTWFRLKCKACEESSRKTDSVSLTAKQIALGRYMRGQVADSPGWVWEAPYIWWEIFTSAVKIPVNFTHLAVV